MALTDLEVFIKERLAVFDETMDLSAGAPIDAQVIQPILRRLGTDPFSVDMATFIETRLLQEFPDLAIKSGDGLTDLIEKPDIILWDPIVREIQRIRNSQSFRDPSTLTVDEAEALGANLFAERDRGEFASGTARIYFAAPQPISIAPANFITSKTGLHFFPSQIQSIRLDEMLLNTEGSLFYFDVSLRAEKAGDEYNIGPDELVTIANVTAAIRITNKRRFRNGLPEETAVQFIDRAQQELTERSLVTLRGIAAVVPKTFPEITRLAVVGFNDPEMQRDVIKGGGLGSLLAAGVQASSAPDGENKVFTRRVAIAPGELPVDLLTLIGPAELAPTGYVLTLYNAFGGIPPLVRDLDVRAVMNGTTLELHDQVVAQSITAAYSWALRRKELTLSDIPGGILFPDGPNGTVTIPDGQVHIGGATDILVRGVDFDSSSVVLGSVVDDHPLLFGVNLSVVNASGQVSLNDLVLGTNYALGDGTYEALQMAASSSWTLQITEGPAAGSYRVLKTLQSAGGAPLVYLSPAPLYAATSSFQHLRWKLVDTLDIDLVEPKETKIAGADMFSVQNFDQLETASGVDLDAFGVAPDDIVRIFNGPDAGDYKVLQVTNAFFTRVQVDRALKFSTSDLRYAIFRKNTGGGVVRPLIRISSIDLLDTSGQPVGSKVPYAKPVDARSTSFANVGLGVRAEARDGRLGLCGVVAPSGSIASMNGTTLLFQYDSGLSGLIPVTFSGANPMPLTSIVAQINAAAGVPIAVVLNGTRLGIIPIGFTEVLGGTAVPNLFGVPVHPVTGDAYLTSRDINSASVLATSGGWSALRPDSAFDVVQVLDGKQIGFYGDPQVNAQPSPVFATGVTDQGLTVAHDFAPEAGVFVQFGSRSIGAARVYFLEPTSIEFGPNSKFSTTNDDGIKLNFFPDPTVETQRIPSLPSGAKPKDGSTTVSPLRLTSLSTDFVKKGVQAGAVLVIDFVPITGTVNLPDPITGLQFQTLVLSINGGPDKTVVFLTDSLAIPSGAVTRAGVATQINQAIGLSVCSIVPMGGGNYLEFDTTVAVAIRAGGTANGTLLGAGFASGANNASPNAGRYNIIDVGTPTVNDITIDGTLPPFGFPAALPRQQFKVLLPGTQRIGSTQMANNKADAGLYFFDVQLVSEGAGDLWNIESSLLMDLSGYESDGYYLTTRDPNRTFSPVEDVTLHVSRSIREVGVSDDPDNATQLSGQNLQVNYIFSSLVTALQNFVLADTERVVNASPLGRHLIPHFVRFDMVYSGGSKESEILPLIEAYIEELDPSDALESSDLQKIVSGKGANSILNPLDLIAVVYGFDRSVRINRSSDKLTTGRLAAFIPDVVTITRKLT
jgi:hypothetical protein